MTDINRIKIAEAMGWNGLWQDEEGAWMGTKPDCQLKGARWYIPDPYTNANDTEAVIRWLNEQRIDVYIELTVSSALGGSHRVQAYDCDNAETLETYSGDDWKAGVCELALTVIENG